MRKEKLKKKSCKWAVNEAWITFPQNSIFYANYVLKGHFTNSTHEIQSTKQSIYCNNICIMSSAAVNDVIVISFELSWLETFWIYLEQKLCIKNWRCGVKSEKAFRRRENLTKELHIGKCSLQYFWSSTHIREWKQRHLRLCFFNFTILFFFF